MTVFIDGTRQVVATYGGDAMFAGSSSPPVSLLVIGASSNIPTLSEWMLLLLGAMLAFAGARTVTRS